MVLMKIWLDVVQHHSPRVLYSIPAASNCARLLRKGLQSGSEVDRMQDVVLLGTRVERREFPAACATVQVRSSWKGLMLVVRERRKGEMGVPWGAGSLGLEKT